MAKKSAKKAAKPAKKKAAKPAKKKAVKKATKKAAKPAAKKPAAGKALKKAAKPAATKAVKKVAKKAAKPAAKKPAAKKAAAPPPLLSPKAGKAVKDLPSLKLEVDKGFDLVRKNENMLARRIEELRRAGERILDQVESLSGESGPVDAALGSRMERLEESVRELGKETQLCNAGPVVERIPQFEADVKALRAEVGAVAGAFEALTDKINELSAKFNMHSHFLKAKNWNQDLLFHADAPSAEDGDRSFADDPKALAIRPARGGQPGEGAKVDLRLTPPRHWDDPVIWFDNVDQVSADKGKK